MTNQQFDEFVKNRLESFRPVYLHKDWLDLNERLERHRNKMPRSSYTAGRIKAKRSR
ncbi:hypothetical protein [Dyadobacter psychrophilus]|jgi:hypothetical protein|nr:hypothetical protein [Dyadobacter psychrophilus]